MLLYINFFYFYFKSEQTEDQTPMKNKRLMAKDTRFLHFDVYSISYWLDSTAELYSTDYNPSPTELEFYSKEVIHRW